MKNKPAQSMSWFALSKLAGEMQCLTQVTDATEVKESLSHVFLFHATSNPRFQAAHSVTV